jgi:hypothetical protein
MVVFPEDKPVIRGLQACYVDSAKLVQYYQQQVGSGCIHFQTANGEGVLFFGPDAVVNSHFSDGNLDLDGQAAADRLFQPGPSEDMQIHVYEIPADQHAFWSQMQSAKAIYSNLSTEFTDLVKLLKKMAGEHLSGYIDVNLPTAGEQGRIFLIDGKFVGGSYSGSNGRLLPGKSELEVLIRKANQTEGSFNVYSIGTPAEQVNATSSPVSSPGDNLKPLEQLLSLFETMVREAKDIKCDFQTCLKKKFVQHVDQFAFLDPFAGEFDYQNGVVSFTGKVDDALLAKGIITALLGLSEDLGLKELLPVKLSAWQQQYRSELKQWGVTDDFPTV